MEKINDIKLLLLGYLLFFYIIQLERIRFRQLEANNFELPIDSLNHLFAGKSTLLQLEAVKLQT
jgi:hypothetical protein